MSKAWRFARPRDCRRWSASGRLLAVGALLLATGGCAYFNTFYHAKQAYARAVRAQEESRSEKLSPTAEKEYDKAIEKCMKVIVEHGGGWRAGIDDAKFLMGASYYGKKDYETAIKQFNDIILNFPDSDHVPDALFYTGLCYNKMRNYATAKRFFDRVLRDHPGFPRRDEIVLTTAEGMEADGDYERALVSYRRLVTEFRDSPKRDDALQRIAEINFDAGEYDSALAAYQDLAHNTRDDEIYFEAQLRAGACLVRLGRSDEAMGIYERILPAQPQGNEQGGRVWLAMAEAENRKAEHEEAIEHLALVSEHFNNRSLGLEADFRLGYTYEVYLKEYEAAREAYEEASRARGQSVFKEQAARRLKNLRNLEELEASSEESDTPEDARAEAALKMAEFSLIESNDPHQALVQYERVERDFPENPLAVRAAFARAWILYDELDSLDAASDALQSVIDRYPESPQAERSLSYLEGIPVAEARRADLRRKVFDAKRRAQGEADSLARIQAVTDSLEALRAAEQAAVSQARADSIASVQHARSRFPIAAEVVAKASLAQLHADSVRVAMHAQVDSLKRIARILADSLASQALAGEPAPIDSGAVPGGFNADSLAWARRMMGESGPPAASPVDSSHVKAAWAASPTLAAARAAAAAGRARADSLTIEAQREADRAKARVAVVVDSVLAVEAEQLAARADSVAAAARADSLARLEVEEAPVDSIDAAPGLPIEGDSVRVPPPPPDSSRLVAPPESP